MKYMNNHFGKNRIPMNLQIFAESGESEGGENGETDGEGGTGGDKPTYEQLVEELAKARTEASQANADKERFKNSVDRLTRQNGELTNQVRERMSADEKAAAEKAEAEAAKDARIQELESKFRLMDYSKRFMGVGMDISIHAPRMQSDKKKGHDSSKLWECRCLICGRTCYRTYGELKYGKNFSCGCLNGKRIKALTQNKTNPALVNSYKTKPPSDNTSGYVGVSFDRFRGKWSANITFQGVKYRLGRFVEKKDAIQARKDAERRLHSDFFKMYQLEHLEEWEKIKNNAQKKAELLKAKHPKENDKAD